MKPYYQHDGCTIYHGDCREVLNNLSVRAKILETARLTLTDPPYNCEDIGPGRKVYLNQRMKLDANEYAKFCEEWFLFAGGLPTVVFTPGISNTHNYPQPKWQLAWHKPAAASFNRMGGFNAWEPVFVYGDTSHVRLGQDYLKYNTLNIRKGPEIDHPCPKPETLWGFLLSSFLPKGAAVLDPFVGSGTTLVVAKARGVEAIGIDWEERYCEIAARRLSQEVLNL